MSEYPDPDEEFELMYAEEFDALRDIEASSNTLAISQIKEFNPIQEPTKGIDQNNGRVCSVNNAVELNLDTDVGATTPVISNVLNETTIDRELVGATLNNSAITTKKRSIQQLFGDIDDILNEEIVEGRVMKRKKNQNSDDLALINHILELRKLAKEGPNHVTILSKDNLIAARAADSHNISYTVPKYSFVTVMRGNGERIYIRCHSEAYEQEELKKIGKDTFKGVMGEAFKDIWEEARLEINKALDHENSSSTDLDATLMKKSCEGDTSLWVDLYRPQRYLELLSDESTNRTLLKWLKLWDKVVFKRNPKIKRVIADAPKTFVTDYSKKFDLNTTLDEQGFPANKVALLCGPPGLGKTTLAHMIATHAGYNVVEANASDDRTPDKFSELLKAATEMEAVIDPKKRPNCVIFDEIDGAPSASIEFLVKFITGAVTNKKKKGTKKGNTLKRPIICICNDVYVPALRSLRQIAFVVKFPPTASARLAERLNEIARHQKIKIDISALQALCEKTENDIRSCLSALHFFKSLSKRITILQVTNINIGQKDTQKALFGVWQSIFHIERSKATHRVASSKSRMQNILRIVNNFGDYEKVAQGVFENYPKLNINDTTIASTCEALEWFCYSDLLNTQIYSLQNYSLSAYLPYCFVVWHFIFGSSSWQKLIYPSASYEVKIKSSKNFAILSEILKGMHPTIRAYTCSNALKMDTLPILSKIVAPPLRPVSVHLYTQQEKEMLLNIINIMIDYNLNYVQERTQEGSYAYNIDPNIDEMTSFSSSNSTRALSYSNKQLIAREVDAQKIRRSEFHKNKVEAVSDASVPVPAPVPNHMQRLKPKTVSPRGQGTVVAKDFFGRVIVKPTSANKAGPDLKTDIWYQYKEGYSNAVRKKIRISSLE